METRGTPATTLIGTFAIVVGALWLFVKRDSDLTVQPFMAGLLVIGGLTLRIEGAIARRRD